jgi:methyltransferase (TIGR00027 family)
MSQQSNKKTAASATGTGPTATAALEQNFPPEQRIIHDDLAGKIIPWSSRVWVQLTRFRPLLNWLIGFAEKQAPGAWAAFPSRKRYIDEQAIAAVVDGEVQAIVNLGAGWDTRLYRLPELAKVPSWEVDMAVNLTPKQARLEKVFGAVPDHVTLVPINFETQDLGATLAAAGYSADKPTFFIWEAVTQYLTEDSIRATFDYLAQAPASSRLAFTYVCRDFIAGENMYGLESFYKRAVVKDKMWLSGWSQGEIAPFLADYGWQVLEHPSYAELHERYVKPTGRDLASMPIEWMVYAEKL